MPRSFVSSTLRLAAVAAAAGSASAATDSATVTVVHGIPDTAVDVCVDGAKALPNFTFKTVTDPISLPAGSHAIAVRPAGAAASSSPILTANAALSAGQNVTIVANLTAAGTTTPVIGPVALDLKGGSTTIVYAIGSLDAKNLTAVTQSYTAASVPVKGVAAGSGGQAADSSAPMLGIALTGVGLLLVGGVAVRTRRRVAVRA